MQLNRKDNIFYQNVSICENDVVVLTETWLRHEILASEYFPPPYHVVKFNGGFRGRGVFNVVKRTYLLVMRQLTV